MELSFRYEDLTTRNAGFVTAAEQALLKETPVFVCGVGGMGGACLMSLVRAGMTRFVLADLDRFEVSNLNRQLFANLATVGEEKVAATVSGLRAINPEVAVRTWGAEWLDGLDEILAGVKMVVNGSDDIRAGILLYRKAREHGATVVDAYTSPLPSVTRVRPGDPRPEERLGYPTVGRPWGEITGEEVDACKLAELVHVATHSSSARYIDRGIAAAVMAGRHRLPGLLLRSLARPDRTPEERLARGAPPTARPPAAREARRMSLFAAPADLKADAVLSWLGALGAATAWLHFWPRGSGSLQQRRARFLLGALTALLTVRGFFWLRSDDPLLFRLTFVPATLVPLGMALFVEGLLRRHLPLALKLLAAGGTAVFFVLNLTDVLQRGSRWVLSFAAFEALLLLALGGVVLWRDRASLSPAENRFIEGIWVALLLAIPLALTDFRFDLGWPPVRLGALGVLLFAYALLRAGSREDRKRVLLQEILGLVARTAVLALALLGAGGAGAWSTVAVACGFVLLVALWQREADARAEVRQGSFLAWWATVDLDRLDRFLAALDRCPVAESFAIVDGAGLAGYDRAALAARLRAQPVLRRPGLEASLRDGAGEEGHRLAEEQLVDLLARRGMEHACLLRAEPLALLLLGHSPLGGSPALDLEIALVQKSAAILAEREAALA